MSATEVVVAYIISRAYSAMVLVQYDAWQFSWVARTPSPGTYAMGQDLKARAVVYIGASLHVDTIASRMMLVSYIFEG